MGNQNQKTIQNGEVNLTINHPKFKNAKLVNQSGQKQMQIIMGFDQKSYQQWNKSLTSTKLNSPYLLLAKKKQFSRKGLCGDSGTLKLNFDNYSYLLTEEIYNKNGKKSKFQQCELWYLLFGLISAQQDMKRKTGNKVGDIRPHNVFLNADGEIKVSNIYSWPRQMNNFNKAFDHQKTYLAPEDIVRLQMGINEQSSNYSSQIFSIGLTVLSAAMLEDFLRLYDTKSYKFDSNEAKNILDEWRSNSVYSQIFTAVISNLCEFQPEKRLGDDQLWNWISKYQKFIKNKEDFVIEEAPLKIDQQIEAIRLQFPQEQPVVYHQQFIQPQHQLYNQHPFTDKSVVQSYIPPNQHYLPNPTFIPQIPGYQHQEVGQKFVTRHQSSPSKGIPENIYIQQNQQINKKLVIGDQYVGQIVGRPLQQHQLPPEVRQAIRQQGQLPQRFVATQYTEMGPSGYSGKSLTGETQMPPQFVGRTVNETYLSPRGGSQGYLPQNLPIRQPMNQGYYPNMIETQGGKERIEETVYIQRPQSLHYQQRYDI